MRLNRYLARAGVASRRKSEEIILSGEIIVNEIVTKELSTEINPQKDTVLYKDKLIELPKYKYYALNKPTGFTCTKKDKYAERTIFDILPNDSSLFSVGRLDKDTSGLILITNDGLFAQNIIHPSNKIPKSYQVKLKTPIKASDIKKLLAGVILNDGPAKATNLELINQNEVNITIEEGRNRIIRRMIRAIGNEVDELKRISIGEISLDVKTGEHRDLKKEEINKYV
jgi:pseudouridine synthase